MSELQKPTPKDDKAEIERLTLKLVKIINSRDFSYQNSDGIEFLAHVAPDFEARFDTEDFTLDWSGQSQKWREDAMEYPQLRLNPLDSTANVRRRSRSATVHLKLAVTGMRENVQYLGPVNWIGDGLMRLGSGCFVDMSL